MTTKVYEGADLAIMGVPGESSVSAVLYGENVTGEQWASVTCPAAAVEQGEVTFRRPGDPAQRAPYAVPRMLRFWLRGKLLRECETTTTVRLLPGDSVTVHVPRRLV